MKCKARISADIIYHGESGYNALIKVRKGSTWNCRVIEGDIQILRNGVHLEIDRDTLEGVFGVTKSEIEG